MEYYADCRDCGKKIKNEEDAFTGIITVLCEECVIKRYADLLLESDQKQQTSPRSLKSMGAVERSPNK